MNEEIKVGEAILVDKGRLGLEEGILVSVDGCSAFGFYGTYKTEAGGIKAFDQSIHSISRAK